MKKIIFILSLVMLVLLNLGATPFKALHSIQLPFEPKVLVNEHTDDFRFFLNSTDNQMAMVDGIEGKLLWTINLMELTGSKKVAEQLWNKDSNTILLFNEDTKKGGTSVKYFVDGKTGNLLWKSEKYISEKGGFSLSSNFEHDYDKLTNGVLLATENAIELVNVLSGETIWTQPFEMEGKNKTFDAYIMSNYDLVRVTTGKDSEFYLTITEGETITDPELYYNQKKAFEKDKKSVVVSIPEKNMYVVMKAKNNTFTSLMGMSGLSSWKMDFLAFEEGTNKTLWEKKYWAAHFWDFISFSSFVKMIYLDDKIFIEHMPNLKSSSGLTVLDANTGDKLWECYYTTLEDKGMPNRKVYTPFPAPDPILVNGHIFVVDKIKNRMYCYSSADGILKWETEKFPDAQKIPTLIGFEDVVILGYGGPEKKISCVTEKAPGFVIQYRSNHKAVYRSGDQKITYKYIYNDVDKYGIRVYNVNTGAVVWDHEKISKALKDKFSYIAGVMLYNNSLYVATDKNFFILNPKTGDMISSVNIKGEKLGDVWKLTHFPEKSEVVLNCTGGIVKINVNENKITGSVKTGNVQGPVVSELIGADDAYSDYAIFTSGNVKKMEYKTFASIDLEKMQIRGSDDAAVIFSDASRFSAGGEYYYKNKGKQLEIIKIK
jgi:outer membrane protein assembly factor BamB